MTFVHMMAIAAHQFGTNSEQFKLAYAAWVEELADKPSHRPPPELIITRNCIQFRLQSAHGNDYRYVPLDKFDPAQFCIELESNRERVLREIRTGQKAKEELLLIEAGIVRPEEGDNFFDIDQYREVEDIPEEDEDNDDDLSVVYVATPF